MLNETSPNPRNNISHAVSVVPIFDPRTRYIDCFRLINFALTKLTIKTVIVEEDCTIEVEKKPVKMPVNRFPDIAFITALKLPLANRFTPSLIRCIPKIKKAIEPNNFITSTIGKQQS